MTFCPVLKGKVFKGFIYLFLAIAIPASFFIFREQPPPVMTVLYKNHVISILENERIEALYISGWKLDKKLTSALQKGDPEYLFSDSQNLAMVNKKGIYIWAEDDLKWKEIVELPKSDEKELDFFIINQKPFLVYPTKVMDLSSQRVHYVPTIKGEDKDLSFLQAVHVSKHRIWFGTGLGEWGGHLLALDVETGKWRQIYTPFFYVNSITEDGDGTIWVAWAMSHFYEDSVLGTVGNSSKKSFYLKDHYLQVIAYNKYDDCIYGLDRNSIVRIKGDRMEKIGDLGEISYITGYYAVGILPLIEDMLIVDKDVFLIPHKWDGLFLYEKGTVRKLQGSKSTAYWFRARYAELKARYKILKLRVKGRLSRLLSKFFNPGG